MYERKKPLWKKLSESRSFATVTTVLYPVLFGILILVLWQTKTLHAILHTDTFTLPLPGRINAIIADNFPTILGNTIVTVRVAILGLLIGSAAGYLIAVLVVIFPTLGQGALAVTSVFTAIPIVALAPVMNNWTKDVSGVVSVRSAVSKIIVVALVCMANMSINAYRGLTEVKPFSEDLMKVLAAKPVKMFTKLRIPNSVPYIFTALKVGVPSSIITTIVSEYFAEYLMGIGRQIKENILMAQYAAAWAYIVTACVIGIALYALLMVVQALVMRNRKAR